MIEIVTTDITTLDVDGIVNAANEGLLGGGGVDGAIHRAAGAGLLEDCRKLNGCPTGSAKVTSGHKLKARHVIHAVGPVWRGGHENEAKLLAAAYHSALECAAILAIRSIAFPAISTGIYGFPRQRAAEIAIGELRRHLKTGREPHRLILVAYDAPSAAVLRQALSAV